MPEGPFDPAAQPKRLPPWEVDVSNLDLVAKTIRQRESGGNYTIGPNSGGASGAYQFIQPTWQTLTRKYGIGTAYSQAYQAPPAIQDQVAKRYISEILLANKGDILSVPYTWYVGNPQGTWKDSSGKTHYPNETPPGNKITVNDYVASWLKDYVGISGQSPGDSTLVGIVKGIGSVISGDAGSAATEVGGGLPSFSDMFGFVSTVWSALTNRDNWIRVGLVFGAILLAIFGMLTVSKSFGGPGVTDVAKTGAAVAA